jgi:hypothetical protein
MDLTHVNNAALDNYRELRKRIGLIAFAFPFWLVLVGLFWGLSVQPTLSDYFFAKAPSGRVDDYPARLWFCGMLFAVGVFLFRYHGFSKNEDRWLSMAGAFTLGVAIFPKSVDHRNDWDFLVAWIGVPNLSLHAICAVLAFACIGIVIFRYSDSTLSELRKKDPIAAKRFKTFYFLIGAYMAVAIGISVILHYLDHDRPHDHYILAAEWSGVWAFSAYWFVKNWELSLVAEMLGKAPADKARAPKSTAEAAEMI